MEIICYNKGTKERNEQKMFISFKKERRIYRCTTKRWPRSRQRAVGIRRTNKDEGGYEKR